MAENTQTTKAKPYIHVARCFQRHSDAKRPEEMTHILFDVTRHHHRLIFSCHSENWRDQGDALSD